MEKGEFGGGYDKTDAARDTDTSTGKVSEAWHQAREDAAKEGGWGVPKDRHGSSRSSSGSDDSGK